MEQLLKEYLPILIFLCIAVAMAVGMVIASFVIASQKPDSEKVSPYECGFEAFDDSRGQFDVRFYLVAILFIIFDLEVAFLFPLGDIAGCHRHVWFLVDDLFSGDLNNWVRL